MITMYSYLSPFHPPDAHISLPHLHSHISREQKFVKNANEHIQRTAQRLTDEDALTIACLQNLEDEVVETERRNARMHLYRWNQGVKKVLVLKGEMESEANSRLSADSALLDTVIDSQQMLQHTVRRIIEGDEQDEDEST
jgi:hypothetical protein